MPEPTVLLLSTSTVSSRRDLYPVFLYSSSAARCISAVLIQALDSSMAAFVFRELKHLPSDALSPRRRINIHAPQFHRLIRGPFEAESADHLVGPDGNPETAITVAVVGRDT